MGVSDLTLTIIKHGAFHSEFLPDDRDVTVFLPPGYDAASGQRYPVLYLHDGQNLFDPDMAFKKGEHWRVGETATELIEAGRLPPLIMCQNFNLCRRGVKTDVPNIWLVGERVVEIATRQKIALSSSEGARPAQPAGNP